MVLIAPVAGQDVELHQADQLVVAERVLRGKVHLNHLSLQASIGIAPLLHVCMAPQGTVSSFMQRRPQRILQHPVKLTGSPAFVQDLLSYTASKSGEGVRRRCMLS